MITDILDNNKIKMQKSLDFFISELGTIRSSRATPALVEGIEVESYGQKMALVQLGTITTPEPREIVIEPWDKTLIPAISKAVSGKLQISASDDGNIIRVPLPPMTQEVRDAQIKLVREKGEQAKVAMRSSRHEGLDELQKRKSEASISEDEFFSGKEDFNKMVSDFEAKADEVLRAKEKELNEI